MTSGVSLWAISIIFLFLTHNFVFNPLIFTGYILGIAGFYFFSNLFPREKQLTKAFFALTAPLLLLLIGIPLNFYVVGMSIGSDGTPQPINGPGMLIFTAITSLYILAGIVRFFLSYRNAAGMSRVRMQYFLLGTLILMLSTILFDVVFPAQGIFNFILLGPASLLVFIGTTAYAILRYHLMNIRVVIRYGIIYSVLIAVLSGIISLVSLGVSQTIGDLYAIILSAVVIAVIIQPLEHFIARITDHILFQDGYCPDVLMHEINDILTGSLLLDVLLPKFLKKISTEMHAKRSAIALNLHKDHYIGRQVYSYHTREFSLPSHHMLWKYFDKYPATILDLDVIERIAERHLHFTPTDYKVLYDEMDALNFQVFIPLSVKDKLIGIFMMGKKLSREPYFTQDLNLLESIGSQLATLIENVRLYERERELYEDLKIADKAKSDFIEVVSHQFRTPLSVIRWDSELLTDMVEGYKKRDNSSELCDAILQSTTFLTEMLDNIFDVLSIEGKKMKPQMTRTVVREVIDGAVHDALFDAKRRSIVIEWNKDSAPIFEIFADAKQIHRILSIFLKNAIKYNHERGSVVVRAESVVRNKVSCALIEIRDTGLGIPEKNIPKVFDKFFRGADPLAATTQGSGLGLYIAKSLIDMHRGEVAISSKVGKGTIVSIYLPLNLGAVRVKKI